MAMTVGELVAYLKLDDKDFRGNLDKSEGRFRGFTGKVGGILKTGMKTAGLAAGVFLATSLAAGFKRLTSIENATAKLTGLGHSAAEVKAIMDNALASVKGTAFGLDEAASIAASAVAAGIKPGQQLESTLKLVADAATIAGTDMGEMGAIFNKVATSNKVQGEVINQLNQRGIPIIQMLAKTMGVSSEKVLELSRAGKIGFAEFSRAMEDGLGGAALESGKTTMGALKNVWAAVGRFGAALLSGVFPIFKDVFGGAITLLDAMTAKVGPLAEQFGKLLRSFLKSQGVREFFGQLKSAASAVMPLLADAFMALMKSLESGGLREFFGGLSDVASVVLPMIAKGFAALGQALVDAGLIDVLKEFWANLQVLARETGKTLSAIARWWRAHGEQVKAVLTPLWEAVKVTFQATFEIIRGVMNIIAGVIRTVLAVIRGDWSGAWAGIKQVLKGASQIIVALVRAMGKLVVAALKAAWNLAVAATRAAWGLLKGAVSAGISAAIAAVRGLAGRIRAAVGNLGSLLVQAGRDLISGLIRGISEKLGALWSKVSGIAGKIRKLKGPLDYDRVLLRPAGQAIIDGLIRGISDRGPRLAALMRDVTSSLAVTPQPAFAASVPLAGRFSPAGTLAAGQTVIQPGAVQVSVTVGDRARASEVREAARSGVEKALVGLARELRAQGRR